MEHRLDTRLLQIPVAELHALSLKLCAIDECRGQWRRDHLFPVADSAKRTAHQSVQALGRVAAFGAEDANRHTMQKMHTMHARRTLHAGLLPAQAGYADVLESVLCHHATMELGERLLLDLHARLFASVPDRGKELSAYRTVSGKASAAERSSDNPAFAPMAAHLVAGETRAAIDWTRSRLAGASFHPLLTIATSLFELLAIRPFRQGNGRMIRILANYLLLRSGYEQVAYVPLDASIAARWTECQVALRRSQASRRLLRPDIAPWLGACLDVLIEHASRSRTILEQGPDESKLSANQLGALRLLDRNREITNRTVCEGLGLPRDTAKQVLKRLVSLGRIESFGAGRAVRYRRTIGRGD